MGKREFKYEWVIDIQSRSIDGAIEALEKCLDKLKRGYPGGGGCFPDKKGRVIYGMTDKVWEWKKIKED